MSWRHISCSIKFHIMKMSGWVEVQLHVFLILALDGSERSASHPNHFTPIERTPSTQWIGGWVGPRASLGTQAKKKNPRLCWELNPSCPVLRLGHCTDWAISVPCYNTVTNKIQTSEKRLNVLSVKLKNWLQCTCRMKINRIAKQALEYKPLGQR
jgi:hypothetical protein